MFNKKEDLSSSLRLKKNPWAPYIEMQEKARKQQIKLKKQATLSYQKSLESEYKKTDMSGMMPWCFFCQYRTPEMDCKCDPVLREKEALCVEADALMQEKLNK